MDPPPEPPEPGAKDADKDDVSDYGDDDGLSWYASAAADADAEEPAPDETAEQEQPEDAAVTDPYVTAESDPYEVFAEEAEEAPADLADSNEPKAVALEEDAGKRAAESEALKPPKPSAAPDLSRPAKVQRTEAPAEPQLTQPAPLPLKQLAEVLQVPPAPEAEAAKAWTPSWLQETSEDTAPTPTDHLAQVPEREFLDQDRLDQALSWDERCVIVRQGQVHIELQHRNPPMDNADLLRFCDWLDEQMPLVVNHFPYVKKSGAYVDLSDNEIGTDGLDKLFQVLRGHRVPCVVLKAYRNSIDDSFVDTLVEYLYTQPEAFPMHGIHISHNDISDKGAFRLIRAAAQCGHYPRLTTRLPLWLRLEVNALMNPQKVIKDANDEGFTVCLMQDGLCSREKCDHYSGVHVQLPYFLNQPAKGFANLEQFGASQRRQTWAAPYSSSQGTLAPKASPVGNSDAGTFGSPMLGVKVKASPPTPSPELAGQQQQEWWPGHGRGRGGWNGGKGGGRWAGGGGGGRGRMWQGKSLVAKVRKDVKLPEGQPDLGFQWRHVGDGNAPRLTSVARSSFVGSVAKVGDCLLRVNGLDMAMMTEKQITDLLKQRPLELRFGDE